MDMEQARRFHTGILFRWTGEGKGSLYLGINMKGKEQRNNKID